ncbi:hypothetical protein E2C01_019443 [Portunus trituberculatus]|uniref:Uncharacterized protein n=1 Tax=Portunus trituberculatus TaxID=210409 RepID=A0A5B7DYW5_PORTR|nr:hypothetical protein [Portunus trituberculatus]
MDRGGGARYYVYCSCNKRAVRQTPNKLIIFVNWLCICFNIWSRLISFA